MAYVNSSRAVHVTLADRIAALFTVAREAGARRALYTQTLRELNALTDRELMDLGLVRGNITSIAREAAYGL